MKAIEQIASGIAFFICLFLYTGLAEAHKDGTSTPLSSIAVEGSVDVEVNHMIRENTQISMYFTLSSDSNGISPLEEDVKIEFNTAKRSVGRKDCLVVYIPAYTFINVKNWYEIYDPENPAERGVRILMVDRETGEITEDFTRTISHLYIVITPLDLRGQYYLLIDASFEHSYSELISSAFIGQMPESVLIVGDDSGSAYTSSIDFKLP